MTTARDLQRWARRGTTTQRGLGHEHQAERARQLAELIDGTPCRRCGQPRYHPDRCPHGDCPACRLDLGHDTPRIHGGAGPRELEHSRCNRQAGARLGQRRRRALPSW